jgi:hypothetical protein
MTWLKYVCGRIKSDFRYSNEIVYNNYPWPQNLGDKKIKSVELVAKKILDVRTLFPDCSLADLYDPPTMPKELTKAHQALDKAVDICYRLQPEPPIPYHFLANHQEPISTIRGTSTRKTPKG